jgi:hypothetical protein
MALATLIFAAMAGIGSAVLPESAQLAMGAKKPSKVRTTAKPCIHRG